MSWIEERVIHGIRCDARGCERTYQCSPSNFFDVYRSVRIQAAKAGWTFWRGRSQRMYCGAHGPSKSSTMTQIHYGEAATND